MNETITFFYYEDIDAVAPFYDQILRLERTMDEDWVKIFRITATSSVGLVQEGRGFHSVSEAKPAMLSIVTDDVDHWYEVLVASNAVIRSKLRPADDDADSSGAPVRGFVIEDPGGYTLEFFSWQKN